MLRFYPEVSFILRIVDICVSLKFVEKQVFLLCDLLSFGCRSDLSCCQTAETYRHRRCACVCVSCLCLIHDAFRNVVLLCLHWVN